MWNAITIHSEDQIIKVSPDGDLYYTSGRELYEGDQKGTIPASYPKGVNPFYIMKYELNDGQYVDFLNSLTAEEQNVRSLLEKENYHEQGGTIAYQEGIYTSEIPQKPCRFASWDDAMAFADWAGLRPMTELEYTKANRGTLDESESTFPWGNQPKTTVQRLPDAIGTLNMANQWNENDLNDDNKHIFGASYYWVMDLSGSVWERVVTVGHEKGRNFKGSHGDGILDESGYANAPDWPSGGDDGGVGFRGGGFYGYDRSYTLFNPFSPIAFRKYGGWHGTMRSIAYGTRFVRSTKN